MGRTARERLARLLDDAEAPGAFSTQILAPADALQVEVDGVGAVPTPVRGPLAKRLIAVGRPAKFGRGEQICGVPTTGGTTSSPEVAAGWRCMPHLMPRAAMLRSALTLNTPQMKQSSTLTGCVGMVATSPAGRRGTDK